MIWQTTDTSAMHAFTISVRSISIQPQIWTISMNMNKYNVSWGGLLFHSYELAHIRPIYYKFKQVFSFNSKSLVSSFLLDDLQLYCELSKYERRYARTTFCAFKYTNANGCACIAIYHSSPLLHTTWSWLWLIAAIWIQRSYCERFFWKLQQRYSCLPFKRSVEFQTHHETGNMGVYV